MVNRRIIPQEEVDMRALVLSEAASYTEAVAKLAEVGYSTVYNSLYTWARNNPKYVPPATLERLRAGGNQRKALSSRKRWATPRPPERRPGPVKSVEAPVAPPTADAIVEAFLAKLTVLRKENEAMKYQLADKNAEIAKAQRQVDDLTRQYQAGQRHYTEEIRRLNEEIQAKANGTASIGQQLLEALA